MSWALAAKIFIPLALLTAWSFWIYHEGAQSVKVADLKTEVKQDAMATKVTQQDIDLTHQEAKTYADAVAAANSAPDPAPVVICVRKYPIVQSTNSGATGGGGDGGGGLPPGAAQPVRAAAEPIPVTDIGGPAVAIGARANAQVAALKAYIQNVCLVSAPK